MKKTLPLVTGRTTKILQAPTRDVSLPLSLELRELLPIMVNTMRKEKGVGLAAPQIGRAERIAVAEVRDRIYHFINPKITSASQEKILFEEGCLSLPGKFFPIVRSEKVTVRYYNEKGLPKKLAASGLLAIVIQHELDHLDGVLIVNRYEKQQSKRSSLRKSHENLS